ncbi:MAG: 23S rRNA (guanosine(2251)-2'-O)-methyltransferase RlmB [Alphaproteobacteria bacterium]|nr:23S rRNA (guanosine(2251)-2'-O)-methyltransferase RlmB [Alphaproteobacteria bacterium]
MKIYGLHTCQEAIQSNRYKINRVYLMKSKDYSKIINSLNNIVYLDKKQFDSLFDYPVVHQGIAMDVELHNVPTISNLKGVNKNYIVAILDNITDPHNLGAIIRSAAVFGVKGIIIHNRSSCKISGTVAKAASGGLEHVDIYTVSNLSNAIRDLKEYGFWIYALCESGDKYLNEVDMKGKACLILGSECSGIRRLQKENADFILKIPTINAFSTLNVSNAAAITFYEVARQYGFNIN